MAKADYSRDYYADLELTSTADVTDIKKQFRKLALKYHPDRNPGKEAEVQAKFQTIQAAHEILTSPEQKQKYDSQRTRSRYPGASGVRGNPWQDYGNQFPTPPRRPGQAPTSAARNNPASSSSSRPSASSANARYSNFNPPPAAKTSKEDLDSRYSAWQKMRPKTTGQSASAAYAAAGANTRKKASAATGASSSMPPPPAPPPPPRTASQRQKADASFGTRRNTGFVPSSPTGDEPAASSTSNYFTARPHPTRVPEQAEPPRTPAASGRESRSGRDGRASRTGSDESLFDARQSTPYQTHGGEKFSLFDDVPVSELHRASSHRAANGKARPEPRRRSSSVPDESDNAAKANTNGDFNGGASSTANTSAPRTGTRTRPGAGQRPSYASSSSTMPMFEEQYRKMQGEHEKQQQQQQQQQQQHHQQDPFSTPGPKQARKPVPNGTSDKTKPGILYGNPPQQHPLQPPQQLPKQNPQQNPQNAPKQAPKETYEKPCPPTTYLSQQHVYSYMHMKANQESSKNSQRSSAFAQHGSDPFLGQPNAEVSPPCVPYPSTNLHGTIGESPLPSNPPSQDDRSDVGSERDQWFSTPLTGEGFKSLFSSTYRSPTVTVTSLANSKRRATTCPTTTMPSSGGTPTTSTANAKTAEKTLKALRRSMNEFEVRQFTVLDSLVNSAGAYQTDVSVQAAPATKASDVQSDASSNRQASQCQEHQKNLKNQKQKHPLHHYTGTTAQPHAAYWRHTNSGHQFSANLSLDDDVLNSPTSPVGQQKSNPFASISVEDINTRFVSDDSTKSAWQFSAGGSEAEPGQEQPHKIHRMQSGNRLGRRSPGKAHSIPRPDPSQGPPLPPKVPSRPASSTGGVADGNTDSASGSSVDGGGPTQRANIFNVGGNNKQQSGSTTTTTDYFDAQRWATQIGSEHFKPPSNQGPPLPPRIPTPNQQQPRPIKKPKPVSRTNTSTATQPNSAPEYIVIEDDSDDESVVETNGEGMASPVAMDIDSPPTGRPVSGGNTAGPRSSVNSSPSSQAAGGVRNIPVEPTRPEWRAGHVDKSATSASKSASASAPIDPFVAASKIGSIAAAAAAAESASGRTGSSVPPPPPAMGSEDSEEFRATLADIRKVEPFAENISGIQGKAGAGLGSFSDLKSQLPFDSKAATPLNTGAAAAGSTPRSGRAKTISFPTPPVAPRPPPTISVPGMGTNQATWDKYVSEFKQYIAEWSLFNQMYTDHFVARQRDLMRGARQPRDDRDRGSGSTATAASGDWVSDTDNAGIDEYLEWQTQDKQVRERWTEASAKHEQNVWLYRQYREAARQAHMEQR